MIHHNSPPLTTTPLTYPDWLQRQHDIRSVFWHWDGARNRCRSLLCKGFHQVGDVFEEKVFFGRDNSHPVEATNGSSGPPPSSDVPIGLRPHFCGRNRGIFAIFYESPRPRPDVPERNSFLVRSDDPYLESSNGLRFPFRTPQKCGGVSDVHLVVTIGKLEHTTTFSTMVPWIFKKS